jgi:hypothetical protein
MEVSGQLHAPTYLPWAPTKEEGGWALEQGGYFGEVKNLLPLTGIEPIIIQPVA